VLLLLIPIAWLAIVTLFVAVCQVSARSEDASPASEEERAYRLGEGLVVWEHPSALLLESAHRARLSWRTPARIRPRGGGAHVAVRGTR